MKFNNKLRPIKNDVPKKEEIIDVSKQNKVKEEEVVEKKEKNK